MPRDKSDEPATPAAPAEWSKRIQAALGLPDALAEFLSRELGKQVTGEPPAVLGVRMQSPNDLTSLIDITGMKPLPGSHRLPEAWGYFIADRHGTSSEEAAQRMAKETLRYALGMEA